MSPQQLKVFYPGSKFSINDLIYKAKNNIIISRHAIPNIDFCKALVTAKNKGVKIRIMLSSPDYFKSQPLTNIVKRYNISNEIIEYSQAIAPIRENFIYLLHTNGINPRYINHEKFFLNHSKFMIIDSQLLYVGSAPNETVSRLDLGIITNNRSYINILSDLFYSDYNDTDFIMDKSSELVIAPNNMRQQIENLLKSAKENIDMMFPVVTDDLSIFNILQEKIQEKITVNILCSPEIISTNRKTGLNYFYIEKLINIGVNLKELYNPKIHCRCIIIDGKSQNFKKAFIGSGNLKTHSFDYSREVGVIISNNSIIFKLTYLFNKLWSKC